MEAREVVLKIRLAAYRALGKPEGPLGIWLAGHREYVGGIWDRIGALQFEFLKSKGLDKERRLIELGLEIEIGRSLIEQKTPQFVISDCFEFSKFGRRYTGSRFYATYFIDSGTPDQVDERRSQAHRIFRYSRHVAEDFGGLSGWTPHYIGEWGHPRGQMMMEYVAS
jgi:hypothetical protein